MASGAITSKKVRVDPRTTESRNLAGAQILLSLFCFLFVSDYDQDSEKMRLVSIRTETRDVTRVRWGPQVRIQDPSSSNPIGSSMHIRPPG